MSMMFERFDTNGDGKITLEEANGTIDTKLADFDADGNGTLSLDEFQGLYLDQTRQMMVRGFQRFDRDGDGQLSREELGAPVEMIFGRMDANDDGAIEKSEMRKRGDGRHGDRDGKGRRGDN